MDDDHSIVQEHTGGPGSPQVWTVYIARDHGERLVYTGDHRGVREFLDSVPRASRPDYRVEVWRGGPKPSEVLVGGRRG